MKCRLNLDPYLETIPTITVHPSNTVVNLTDDTAFLQLTCMAIGAKSYHWERQDGSIPCCATGANTNTLTLVNLTATDVGNYRCIACGDTDQSFSNYASISICGQYVQVILVM